LNVSFQISGLCFLLIILIEGRIKAACDLVAQYIPPNVKEGLLASYECVLSPKSPTLVLTLYSLAALHKHIQTNSVDGALKSATNTKDAESKAEADKKRKAVKASAGVEKLKKANVKGMAKMTSFFTKAEKSK